MQPIVQQFEVPKFDFHEDRSMTMALQMQKKPVLQDVSPLADPRAAPHDKENSNKPIGVAAPLPNVRLTYL